MATTRSPKKTPAKTPAKPARKPSAAPMTLAEAMAALEQAGSAQTRKTYLRHGAQEPMFGTSFAALKVLVKRIKVDHALARALWKTKNHDARMLAIKVADPAQVLSEELDAWAREMRVRSCGGYVAMLAAESPLGAAKAREWLSSKDDALRAAGWILGGHLASLDEALADDWFEKQIARIEKSIHGAPNAEREAMNMALIQIGCRSAGLRKQATAAAKRIGVVEVDHGDTACKTPDAASYIAKTWAHAESKGYPSPAAQERDREPMRTRC